MKTIAVAVRLPLALVSELRALQFSGETIGPLVRRLLANSVGRPELASIDRVGYPRGRKRPERAKAS